MESRKDGRVARREFLAGAAGAAAMTVASPGLALGTKANSKIELGLIGCGGRGVWIADLFENNADFKFVAVAEYFEDRAEKAGERFGVEPSRRHTGLSAYKRLLEKKLDGIVIESPPYFHPEQAAAGVEAGRHVFVAKPIAVDVPGCLSIGESGKRATEKKLAFLVDFQTRTSEFYREAVKRVNQGDIGKVALIQAYYQTGGTWGESSLKDPEVRLRAWGVVQALSGDIIVEQNIHAVDVATWFVGADAVSAWGTGGRKVRSGAGDCWDHYAVIYRFPGDVIVDFSSTQYNKGCEDICCRVYGSRGTADTHYAGAVSISGDVPFKGGVQPGLYAEGAVSNIKEFHRMIAAGDSSNPTVAPSVRSNLTCVLGRMATRARREFTWDEMMRAKEKLDGKLDGLKD
jgi:myo-inositol 2-dehydrogenase/D-chiro-inositol 1-dehydrogenase